MKSIKAIIFAAIIICSYAVTVKRVEKTAKKAKAKAQMKDEGSGSYDSGFDCPGILVVTGNTAFDENKRLGAGKFYPKNLDNPNSGDDKIGFCFDLTSGPSGDLAKILVKMNNKKHCFLYRHISSDWTYTNPTGFKYLEGWVTPDDGNNYRVRILLPWARFSWYINDEEGKKVAGNINKQRTTHRSAVDTSKARAQNACNSYISNKPLLDAANSDSTKLAAEKKKQEDSLTTLKTQQTNHQTELDSTNTEIAKIQNDLQKLYVKRDNANANLVATTDAINTIQNNLKTMDGGAKAADLAKTYKTAVETAKSDLTNAINDLRVEAPNRKDDLELALKCGEGTDFNAFKASLATIRP